MNAEWPSFCFPAAAFSLSYPPKTLVETRLTGSSTLKQVLDITAPTFVYAHNNNHSVPHMHAPCTHPHEPNGGKFQIIKIEGAWNLQAVFHLPFRLKEIHRECILSF